MSKAFNNSVPRQLRWILCHDHEDQEHLKPQLVHLLANAELYCLSLGNIYSDPNYHNMNHTGVLQVLLRKGVFVSDTAPTETVLIQTNPLKMSAHLSVMEAVMTLYAKEVATPDRVLAAVQRFSLSSAPPPPANTAPADHEQALLLWVRNAVAALRERILEETGSENEGEFPKIGDLGDLGDGALLAGLVAFYCPEELAWQSITLSKVPSMTDRLRNLMLVHEFCQHSLPYSVFHMTPEDVCYMRESMKQNLLVFLADLFNVLEIHPAKCVRFDRNSASLTQGSPLSSSGGLKKSHSIHQTEAPPMDNREETFVVHRGKGIPTLSSMQQQQQDGGGMTRAMKEAAGKPSNWEDSRRSSYAGRRSRRNSLSEDSQLTLENFGGSQENLHFLGRNPDKEPAVHVGRRDSSASRSSLNDNKSTNLHNALQQEHNGDAVHAELRKASAKATANSDELASILGGDSSPGPAKKTTTFATLPAQSTTTWQQQQQQQQHKPPPPPASSTTDSQSETESADGQGGLMGSTLLNIRLKLEEKRRRIESDKRRMEAVMNRQRQKVGKAAFLQAVTKGQNQTGQKTNTKLAEPDNLQATNGDQPHLPEKLQRPISLQDITDVEQKWLSENENERKPPDIDSMDLETCQQSIAQYNSSLQEIQLDLQRLSNQQSEISQPPQQPPPQPSPQPQPFHQPPLQQQQQTVPMASFATLNSYANRGGVPSPQMNNFGGNQQPPQQPQSPHQQMHSLMYNNHTGQNQQWHSLMNQQPNNYHNDFMQQQQMQNQQNNFMNHQQVHSLMNQQPMNSFATLNNHRNYPNSQGGGGFILNQANNYGGAADLPYQPQSHQQQHHQMNQLMHGGDSAGEFYLHDPPPTPQRRTWGQPPPPESHTPWTNSHSNHHHSQQQPQQPASLSSSPHTGGGFMLHHNGGGAGGGGGGDSGGYKTSPPSLAPTPPPRRVTHAPLPTPPVDDMEPQSISFIGADEDELNAGLNRIHITSGSRTYRIPSPTRTHTPISRSSFTQQQQQQSTQRPSTVQNSTAPKSPHVPPQTANDKGFYISFDDDTPPKRPKPPLRVKRMSPKKERALTQVLDALTQQSHNIPNNNNNEIVSPTRLKEPMSPPTPRSAAQPMRVPPTTSQLQNDVDDNEDGSQGVGLIIGSELLNPDPSQLDEMERKKERILLLSLQRRQAQEEAKARKEAEAARRKENEKRKEEERLRKKEEEKARRAAILDQYKLKKAIEEAEREGKNVDKEFLNSLKIGSSAANMSVGGGGGGGGPPKMRSRTQPARPRPKTIHIDSGSAPHDTHDGTLTPSRGKKGSSSNLSVYNSSPMRRDYYRGSQDSLAETRRTTGSYNHHTGNFGEDSRGASPGRTLGRRGSYKTSRDPSPDRPYATQYGRSRSNAKYGTYQGRRKSNSLMNLSGSSCDQDSLLYRYGDTDSGLGRATPPRRAPSPGQHPPSPSGPGSLPAHRRRYDDTASESGSDYSGPRLYKQPATKSNKVLRNGHHPHPHTKRCHPNNCSTKPRWIMFHHRRFIMHHRRGLWQYPPLTQTQLSGLLAVVDHWKTSFIEKSHAHG
ncbi:hypothetical protein LSTR_LSTR000563 [Laodelphax striatellus]|uniref:Calponin-homology (CH) domain-containing protein n=1 Tax=Laodelphax striatellus TaxID=195883 RepID=A0A482WPP2_LAOST|nr:hypothetical protein LSTR_LSTR000563 [Laodelphax striatellus]